MTRASPQPTSLAASGLYLLRTAPQAENMTDAQWLSENAFHQTCQRFLEHDQKPDKEHLDNLRNVADALSGVTSEPLQLVTATPGMGKSVSLSCFLLTLALSIRYGDLHDGVIVCIEKVETAFEIADDVQRRAGTLGGNTPFITVLHDCRRSYRNCQESDCPSYHGCIRKGGIDRQAVSPIVVLTHARAALLESNFDAFRTWQNGMRTSVIYDEKPERIPDEPLSFDALQELRSSLEVIGDSRILPTELQKKRLLQQEQRLVELPFYRARSSYTTLSCCYARTFSPDELRVALDIWDTRLGENTHLCQRIFRRMLASKLPLLVCRDRTVTLSPVYALPFCADQNMRVVVLSGTGHVDPDLVDCPDCRLVPFRSARTFEHLTIHCLRSDRIRLSKTAMEGAKKQEALSAAAALCTAITDTLPDTAVVLPVTYKSCSADLYQLISKSCSRNVLTMQKNGEPIDRLVYFGGVLGANYLNTADHIVFLGLGRLNHPAYTLRALTFNTRADTPYTVPQEVTEDFEEPSGDPLTARYQFEQLVNAGVSDRNALQTVPALRKYMVDSIVTDLVQMIYRTRLRNSQDTHPVHVWICNPDADLLDRLAEQFPGCHVCDADSCLTDAYDLELTSHKTRKDQPTAAARVLQWARNWDGTELPLSRILELLGGMTQESWKRAHKDDTVKKYFAAHIVRERRERTIFYRKKDVQAT